jgi:hypothetical protein
MPYPSHPPWLDNSRFTWRRAEVTKLLIMQYSPTSVEEAKKITKIKGAWIGAWALHRRVTWLSPELPHSAKWVSAVGRNIGLARSNWSSGYLMGRCGQPGVHTHLPAKLTTCPRVTGGRTEAANPRFTIKRTVFSGKLLLAFASTVILRFGPRGTHDRIFSWLSGCYPDGRFISYDTDQIENTTSNSSSRVGIMTG